MINKITWFISAHGFGHAARSVAIMEEMYKRNPSIQFQVLTEVPEAFFFFQAYLPIQFVQTKTDVGLIQLDPFKEDIPQTIEHLNGFYFNLNSRFRVWDQYVLPFSPDLIISDIAPSGLLYASEHNIESVLIENFTWDWLYEHYPSFSKDFKPINQILLDAWSKAKFRFTLEPYCFKSSNSILVPPVSRKSSAEDELNNLKNKLEIDESKQTVLITMGGVPASFSFYSKLKGLKDYQFIIAGNHKSNEIEGTIKKLSHHSGFYHPDLVEIADVVIAKVGYSTIAEVFHSNKLLGYIPRDHFRETEPLVNYIKARMNGFEINHENLNSGEWVEQLTQHSNKLSDKQSNVKNGSTVIVDFLF